MVNRGGGAGTDVSGVRAPLQSEIAATLAWLAERDVARRPEVEWRTRLLLLDTVAFVVAGLGEPEPRALADRLGRLESGRAGWPGADITMPATSAAFVGALAACWHEACEGLARAHGRPGLHAVPVAVALGQALGATVGDTLDSIVWGYEIGARSGEAMRIRPGLHVDGSWGVFAAVGAASRMFGLSPEASFQALAVAAGQMPVSQIAPIIDGVTARNTFAARACANGIMIAAAAAAGVTGTARSFGLAADALAAGGMALGPWAPPGEFLILQGYLKSFAAARHVHYGALCAIECRSAQRTDTSSIVGLELAVYPEAAQYCANRAPTTPMQAQFSLTHGLAFALRTGALGPEAYADAVFADAEQRRLEALARVVADPSIEGRGARLTVTTVAGSYTYRVNVAPGDVARPMTDAEVTAKAQAYLAPRVGAARASVIVDQILKAPRDHRFNFFR